MSNVGKFYIDERHPKHGCALISAAHIRASEVVVSFKNSVLSEKSYLTIQVGKNKHALDSGPVRLLNHLCDPNLGPVLENREFVALRDILPNEVLGFFYPSTEWEMERPFICNCGSKDCLGYIRGAKFISPAELVKHSKGMISPVIFENFKEADYYETTVCWSKQCAL